MTVETKASGTTGRPRGRRSRRETDMEGLKQLSMLWFYVKDLRQAVRYYRDQVGFRMLYLDEDSGWATFATGAEGVDLALTEWNLGGEVPRGGGACPVFEVVDLAGTRAKLEARGVVFDGEIVGEEGVRRHTTFHDPDGNPIQLTQVW